MPELSGKCHCGENTFAVNAEPEFQFVCCCDSCKNLNGGGHLCGMMFDEGCFTEASSTQTYSYPGGSGQAIDLHFCPKCATQLYAYPREYPGKVVVRVNTIRDSNFKPQHNLFGDAAFEWDTLPNT